MAVRGNTGGVRQLMTNLERIQAKARELARSGKFHGWRPIAFELRFEAATRKRAQLLKMSLTNCVKLLAKPRTRPLELKFSVSSDRRGYCTALCTLVRRMKTRRARIAKIRIN
jgi:hypothetical protein